IALDGHARAPSGHHAVAVEVGIQTAGAAEAKDARVCDGHDPATAVEGETSCIPQASGSDEAVAVEVCVQTAVRVGASQGEATGPGAPGDHDLPIALNGHALC